MIKLNCFLFLFLLLFTSAFAGAPMSGPTGLMVEFLRDPSLGTVRDPLPNFSWILSNPEKNSQRSYQILVSSSRQKLEAGVGDAWNSGRISSDQSVGIKYAGQPLKSNALYFWRVVVWNSHSPAGMNSGIQEFRTGSFEKGYQTSVMPLSKNTIKPLLIIGNNSRGNYFADFGKAAFGTLRVQIESKKKRLCRCSPWVKSCRHQD